MFEELDSIGGDDVNFKKVREIVRAPFGWGGGKSRSLDQILPRLPYYKGWVDVFGGSGAVTLARTPSALEVYNDRYSGVTNFYSCLRDESLTSRLMERLEWYIHSREEWYNCQATWDKCQDPVDRAARWFYMITYSFAKRGDAFGRSTYTKNPTSGIHFKKLLTFKTIHERLKKVMIENMDFRQIFKDYGHPDTVFYCDPPYTGTYHSNYFGHAWHETAQRDLCECIFNSQSFVALSGVSHPITEGYPWDAKYTWQQYRAAKHVDTEEGEEDADLKNKRDIVHAEECLWIKERK